MKVTYLGDGVVDKVGFDGHDLPKGVAVDYTPSHPARLETLKNHPYFEVEQDEPEESEEDVLALYSIMDEKELKDFALRRYGVKLDRRQGKTKMIAALVAAIEEDADGSSDAG